MAMSNWPNARSWLGLSSDQRDYTSQIARMAGLYSHPILIGRRDQANPIGNGSGFLFKPDARRFLVTNAHVIEGFESVAAAHGDAIIQFGDRVFDPVVVAREKVREVDLAVIDIGELDFPSSFESYWGERYERLETYAPTPWPMPPPINGDPVVIVGWPGKHRVLGNDRVVEFASIPLVGLFIADVGPEHFTIPFEREDYVSSDFDPSNKAFEESDFEGISGAPVFVMQSGPQPLRLVGLVHAFIFDALVCTRADLISVDGSIILHEQP